MPHYKLFAGPVPIALFCALGVVGCGEVKKAGECTNLIEVLNEAAKIEAKPGKDDLSEEIKAFEEADAKIGKVELTDAGLKKHVDDYRALLKTMIDNVKAAEKLGKAAEKVEDPAQVEKLQKELDALDKKMDGVEKDEEKIVNDLNTYCNRT